MWFKSCEKCGGDFFTEEDGHVKDLVCLQCGYRPTTGPSLEALRRQPTRLRSASPRA